MLGWLLAAGAASAGPWDASTRYPAELRGAWLHGDRPSCHARDVLDHPDDMLIRADHIRQAEMRRELVSLQPMMRRHWRSTERVFIDERDPILRTVALTLSRNGRQLTVEWDQANGVVDEQVYTRCR